MNINWTKGRGAIFFKGMIQGFVKRNGTQSLGGHSVGFERQQGCILSPTSCVTKPLLVQPPRDSTDSSGRWGRNNETFLADVVCRVNEMLQNKCLAELWVYNKCSINISVLPGRSFTANDLSLWERQTNYVIQMLPELLRFITHQWNSNCSLHGIHLKNYWNAVLLTLDSWVWTSVGVMGPWMCLLNKALNNP